MSTVNEKMTALANEIRELSGTTTSKSIDMMTSDVNEANAEITTQTELLEQIAIALEDKASGGTTGGGTAVEAWTGTVYGPSGLGDFPNTYVYYTDENLVARGIEIYPREEATITIAAHTYVGIYWDLIPPQISENTEEGIQMIGRGSSYSLYLPIRDNFILS
jgi:hypothetical protein